ncbi:MAG: succinate dehydrogenase assembly factor 2 [Candidatus Polarisedimenticolaceae bacterium]|nr:succinate dehydrogenase assembly factor 2 [Candidatus Polarisedimenticolaceae bacterium]
MNGAACQPGLERLRWQCRRGLLELDLLFEAFLDKRYSSLSDADKESFNQLLEHQDQTLQEWLLGKTAPEDEAMVHMVRLIRDAV